jgi:hypothetical protein
MDAYRRCGVAIYKLQKKKFFAYVTPSRDWYIPEKREKKYALYSSSANYMNIYRQKKEKRKHQE